MKVLVIGALGRLGSAIVREFSAGADVVALSRAGLDITDDAAVSARVAAEAPDVIVNCAAYNAVDAAQDDPVTALNVNALGVRAIARAAAGCTAPNHHGERAASPTRRVDHSVGRSPSSGRQRWARKTPTPKAKAEAIDMTMVPRNIRAS